MGSYELSPSDAARKRRMGKRRRTFVGDTTPAKNGNELLLSPTPTRPVRERSGAQRTRRHISDPPKPHITTTKASTNTPSPQRDAKALNLLSEMNRTIKNELDGIDDTTQEKKTTKKKNNGRRRRTFNSMLTNISTIGRAATAKKSLPTTDGVIKTRSNINVEHGQKNNSLKAEAARSLSAGDLS